MYFFSALLGLLFSLGFHDIHMSNTECHYKSEKEALQVTIHLFIDDFEKELNIDYQDKINLFNNNENPLADSLIQSYFERNLVLKLDQQPLNLNYLGREMSDDLKGVYCYLEAENIKKFKSLYIKNNLLLASFDDQRNIIKIKVDNKSKAFHILDKKDSFKEIRL